MTRRSTTATRTARSTLALLTVAAVGWACTATVPEAGDAGAGAASPPGDSPVDLTHSFGPDAHYWPTGEPFEYERTSWGKSADGDWYAAGAFSMPEHLGTHLDAPIHFSETGWSAEEIPVDRLVAPGLVVDIAEKASRNGDAALEPPDLVRWERENGEIPAGSIFLVRTGWSSRWSDRSRYFGSETPDDPATLHFPGISPEAARLLVQRRVVGVGIDTASLDPGAADGFPAHRILAGANVFGLENLARLDELPARGFRVLALPMKIAGGTGGPARVVALPEH